MTYPALTALTAATAILAGDATAADPATGHVAYAVHHVSGPVIPRYQPLPVRGTDFAPQIPGGPDIVDTAVDAGLFGTLVKAVRTAGLVDTLKSSGPFTIFAPTDAAFARLPAGTLDDLMRNPDKLARVLKFHVVPGRLDAKAVNSMSRLATVAGTPLSVRDISTADTDVMTSNGIIHAVDSVLMPDL